MFRIGELTNLTREDVLDSGDLRVSAEHKGLVLKLSKTKTGPNKSVEVLEPAVITIFRDYIGDIPISKPKQKLFTFTGAQYRYQFKKACKQLGLSGLYVPHSLRHGGATRYYRVMKMPIEDVMFRGRWQSNDSARRYIQQGMALQMTFAFSDQMEIGRRIINDGILPHISLSQEHYYSTSQMSE